MSDYKIHNYNSNVAEELAFVSSRAAENWVWPYQHSTAAFNNLSSKPDFDSNLLLYCTKGTEIVGYILADIGSKFIGSHLSVEEKQFARVIFPCTLPGHELARDLLLEKVFENLKNRVVKLVRIRASTMISDSFDYLTQLGFNECATFPMGYKLYYQYNSDNGKIDYSITDVQQFDEQRDLNECTSWVAKFFNIPSEDAKSYILQTNSREDLTSHLVIRNNNELVGYCFASPNGNNKKIHANFYIEAKTDDYFKQLLAKSVNNGIDANSDTFIVDLIDSILIYEKSVKSLGFEKVATWCVFEKRL